MTKIAAGQKFSTVASTVDTNERKSTTQNAKTEMYTIEDLKETVLGTPDEILYTEVAVPSVKILSIESSPVQLLPAPGAGKYYQYDGTVEYTHVSTNYTTTSMTSIGVVTEGNFAGSFISPTLISTAASGVAGFSSVETNPYNTPAVIDPDAVNQPIIMAGIGANPTLGDGTILVKIWYKVRTFGTEL